MFVRKNNTDTGTFTRSHQGLSNFGFHREGKVACWVKLGDMTHLSSFKKCLLCFVQNVQASIFFVAHYYILFLISFIFVIVGQEQW